MWEIEEVRLSQESGDRGLLDLEWDSGGTSGTEAKEEEKGKEEKGIKAEKPERA